MKLLFDFLPIVLFFATFKVAEGRKAWAAEFASGHFGFLVAGGRVGPDQAPVMLATLVVIAATLAQVLWLKARRRKVDKMLWVSLALVVVLGSLTIWFQNETFIKWKPTVLYWVMAAVLALAPLLAGRNLMQTLLGAQMRLPAPVWHRLNLAWVLFFAAMGLLNIWVAYSFSTDTWVSFKLFGGMGLMFAFIVAQALYLGRHAEEPGAGDADAAPRER
ncbi:MAG: septation protein A [Rubrivivax sp.]